MRRGRGVLSAIGAALSDTPSLEQMEAWSIAPQEAREQHALAADRAAWRSKWAG